MKKAKKAKKRSRPTTVPLDKKDAEFLRWFFFMLANGGYDAREFYCGMRGLADIVHRIDPHGEKLMKDP